MPGEWPNHSNERSSKGRDGTTKQPYSSIPAVKLNPTISNPRNKLKWAKDKDDKTQYKMALHH